MNDDIERCPATNRNGEPCGHPAGWGTDGNTGPCKFHGGAADNRGRKNGNWKHGAFSDHLRSDLTDAEKEALDDMAAAYDDPEEAKELIREQAAEAWLKYKRSGDHRFLREYRQLAETFNLAPNSEKYELEDVTEGDGGFGTTVVLDSEYVDDE